MTNLSTPVLRKPMPDLTEVTIGRVTLWWSFDTLIGIQVDGARPMVRKNVWSQKTGKHLNHIDGGDKAAQLRRLDRHQFDEIVESATWE